MTRRTAYMLTPKQTPLVNHDTAAAASLVPDIAAPAAGPHAAEGLKGTGLERARGRGGARRRRVGHGLLGEVLAGHAAVGGGLGAVLHVRGGVFAEEVVGDLMAHDD